MRDVPLKAIGENVLCRRMRAHAERSIVVISRPGSRTSATRAHESLADPERLAVFQRQLMTLLRCQIGRMVSKRHIQSFTRAMMSTILQKELLSADPGEATRRDIGKPRSRLALCRLILSSSLQNISDLSPSISDSSKPCGTLDEFNSSLSQHLFSLTFRRVH